jgi:lysophospholipase
MVLICTFHGSRERENICWFKEFQDSHNHEEKKICRHSRKRQVPFKSHDGLKIFYREYRADNERARLVIAHGLAEHSGRYGNVIEWLFPDDISIWALDHRGHGQSDGPRGHISSFDQYVNDLKGMLEIAKAGIGENTRLFLLGHSMGGLISLMFAFKHPDMIDGLIVSSPGLGVKVKIPAFKVFMGKLMSSIWPGLSLGNELDSSKISQGQGSGQEIR